MKRRNRRLRLKKMLEERLHSSLASRATTAVRLDHALEVISPVVVGQLFTRSYFSLGIDEHLFLVFGKLWFTIWFAAVVDVAGDVLAAFAVDGPFIIEFEEVFAAAPLRFVIGNDLTSVFDDQVTFLERRGGKKPETRATSFHYHFFSFRHGG